MMAAQGSFIQHDPVFTHRDALHVRLAGMEIPILMHGAPVERFLPGWRAELIYTGFAPIFVLQLVHADGRRATWFLDQRMQHVGDSISLFAPEAMALMRHRALPLLRRLLDMVLTRDKPVLDHEMEAFLDLHEPLRIELAARWAGELIASPQIMLAEHLQPAALLFRGEGQDGLTAICREHIARGLEIEFQDRVEGFVRDRAIVWASPVDGQMLRSEGGFCLDDFFFAYRFSDSRHGLVFFVIVGGHFSRAGGLWFPSLNLIVCRDGAGGGVVHLLSPRLPHLIATHVCTWARLFVPAWQRGMHRIASVMRGIGGAHIGHQLWNELSGAEHFLRGNPETELEWIVLDAAEGTEFFGPVDALFPEMLGHVDRSLSGKDSLIRHAYSEGVFVLRVTRDFVSERLRRRIIAWACNGEAGASVQQALAPIAHAAPVLLLGLRVENRTVHDLPGFYVALLIGLISRYPGLVIVFDGHNERETPVGPSAICSYGESHAAHQPSTVERELVDWLRLQFAAAPVTMIDTVGKPITYSIAWADRCDAFFSIWGASLSKYRWVCNKVGLTVTSSHNMHRRADLHIYDSPDHMEAPTMLDFVEPELVSDLPDASKLVDIHPGDPAFFNFSVDMPGLLARLFTLLDGVARGSPV